MFCKKASFFVLKNDIQTAIFAAIRYSMNYLGAIGHEHLITICHLIFPERNRSAGKLMNILFLEIRLEIRAGSYISNNLKKIYIFIR